MASKRKNTESIVQIDFCEYIKDKYPAVIFTSESGGIRLTMGQSIVAKRTRSCRGLPDVFILEPRKGYFGLFIEIKKEGERVFKKNGEVISNDHVREQREIHERLKHKGYLSMFAIGLEQCKEIMDWYMS